ncbi:MAG: cbb3-type cytochrome c oxidase N-terminal domain-containing protein [Niabella sp.]
MKKLTSFFYKAIGVLLLMIGSVTGVWAQDAAPTPAPASGGFVFDVNTVLALVVIFLFFIIAVLGFTLQSAMELYKDKKKKEKESSGTAMKAMVMIGLLCLTSFTVMAQAAPDAAAAVKEATFSNSKLLRYLLLFIIVLEFIAILYFVKWIKFFTGIEEMQQAKDKKGFFSSSFSKWWTKVNKLKPIEEEASLDVGHSYDGIHELDNATPPWFTVAFIASIIFGLGYLWRYHVAESAPDQYQEYENSVTEAKMKLEAYMKSQGDQVDETNVVMLGASDIDAGKTLFAANCSVCHGDKGQGGVGPNLTDDYWLHGGKINDIFKTIKLGVVEKGMQSWKDVFSGNQIAQLSSYIKTLHGTNPPGGKEPQGEVFKEEAAPAAAADSTATKPAADSASAAK